MRQRVAAALASSLCGGRNSKNGRPASLAARCSFWLVFKSSRSIVPATAGWRRRTQRLGHRPQRFFAVRSLDHNHATRIETESIKAMSGESAVPAPSVSRHDEDNRVSARQAGEKRHDETEGRRLRGFGRGHDFMQGAGGEAAFRQIGIERVEAEAQSVARAFADGKKPAQFMDHGSARRRHGKGIWFKHLNRLSPWTKHLCSLYVLWLHSRTK
jgi:hypothetical protein